MSAESEILLIKKSFSITPPIDPPLTVGEDFSLSTQEIYFSDSIFIFKGISASPTAFDSAVGEDLFFIGKLFIKQA